MAVVAYIVIAAITWYVFPHTVSDLRKAATSPFKLLMQRLGHSLISVPLFILAFSAFFMSGGGQGKDVSGADTRAAVDNLLGTRSSEVVAYEKELLEGFKGLFEEKSDDIKVYDSVLDKLKENSGNEAAGIFISGVSISPKNSKYYDTSIRDITVNLLVTASTGSIVSSYFTASGKYQRDNYKHSYLFSKLCEYNISRSNLTGIKDIFSSKCEKLKVKSEKHLDKNTIEEVNKRLEEIIDKVDWCQEGNIEPECR